MKDQKTIQLAARIITMLTYFFTAAGVVFLGIKITGGISLWLIPLDLLLVLPVLWLVRLTLGQVMATIFGFSYGLYLEKKKGQ